MGLLARDAQAGDDAGGLRARSASVLTFHTLEDTRDAISFPPRLFRSGLMGLAGKGLRTESLEAIAVQVLNHGVFSPRAVALTFDDGYETVYSGAFPVLSELGMTATVFLCTGGVADSRSAAPLPSLCGRRMLNWAQIREMHRAGITFGAHTVTHPDLTQLPPPRVEAEIRDSQARIEDALGARVCTFAYPFGRFDRTSREIAGRYFDVACSDRLGLVRSSSDVFALPRVDAYYLRSRRTFAGLPSRYFGAYVAARALPRGLRRKLMNRAGG